MTAPATIVGDAGSLVAGSAAHAIGETAAASLAATLRALADPLRLRMLSAIATDRRGESCVYDLVELADVSQPTVSHHLKVLRDVGVLTSQRRGTWVWYRIAPELRPAVTTLLDSFAPVALAPAPPVAGGRLDDAEADLARLAAALNGDHPEVGGDVITTIVRESYTALVRTAQTRTDLLCLTERFARQRVEDIDRDRDGDRPQVLFVCVANAGRSQLAAALLEERSGGRVVARSAGSAPAAGIHAHVRPLLAEIAGGDSSMRYPKPLTDDAVRAADVVVTMGCGDVCPVIPGVRYEDWAVGDPALASAPGVAAIRDDISRRVDALLDTLPLTARSERP